MTTPHRRADDGTVTVGEVNRNVIDLRQVMTDFITEVRSSYVRGDVYEANNRASTVYVELLQKRVDDLEDAREEATRQAANNRRLAVTAIIAPLIVGIILAVLTAYLK